MADTQTRAARRLADINWRYLPGGTVKHALQHTSDAGAVCGTYTLPADNWRGTGTQTEYETVEALRPCRHCLRKLGVTPEAVPSNG